MAKHTKRDFKREKKTLEYRKDEKKNLIVFSLKHFDINQGQSFEVWEKKNILAKLMTIMRELSSLTIIEAINKAIIKKYGEFPPNGKTEFVFPIYLHPRVCWATLHIAAKERVAGYIEDNIFYIVFLDKDHRFWISEKKHT
jgi:hypothetical protein